jgi:seryl-tRNA synthetase
MESLKKQKNDISRTVAQKKKDSKGQDKCEEEIAQSKALDGKIEELEAARDKLEKDLAKELNKIGNIISPNVPISNTEDDNKVIRTWGVPSDLVVTGEELGKLHHHEVMQCLDIIELERGSRVAGHRGYFLKGLGVLLNQALINFGIKQLIQKGYTPTQPPFFVKKSVMEATCQLSDFSENLYQVEGNEEGEPYYLIATSEQPISAMHLREWIEPGDLPKHYAGISSCFRKEAGSHGKDVWGIFRVHQFEKVEQFVYCDPKTSWEEFEKMIATSEDFYKALELPYQVIAIVSGALNDAAAMKYDLEAWFPGYKAFRELVSCSNCTDYQARALETRYALKNTPEKLYVHMLNGTMCATERTMCCIMENYQTPEGLRIPKVL